MPDYSKPLAQAIRSARNELGLTQDEVAAQADVDVRTVLNIENDKGNPKMEVLYPLVRALKMDPRSIFYPEMQLDTPARRRLRLLVETCSEQEAEALTEVFQSVLTVLRAKKTMTIE